MTCVTPTMSSMSQFSSNACRIYLEYVSNSCERSPPSCPHMLCPASPFLLFFPLPNPYLVSNSCQTYVDFKTFSSPANATCLVPSYIFSLCSPFLMPCQSPMLLLPPLPTRLPLAFPTQSRTMFTPELIVLFVV